MYVVGMIIFAFGLAGPAKNKQEVTALETQGYY